MPNYSVNGQPMGEFDLMADERLGGSFVYKNPQII
jgi:hypothetical protein